MENQKLLTAEATQEQEKFIQPTFDDITKEAADEVRAKHGLSEGQVVEGYGTEGQVGYVDSVDPTTGKAQVKIMSREAAEARAPKTVEEASEIDEPRTKRLQAFDEVAERRSRKFSRRAVAVAAGVAAFIGTGVLPPAGESTAPRAVAQEQTVDDSGITPFKSQEAKDAATFGTTEHTEAAKADYEQELAKQYAEDDKLSTFDGKNKVSEKAFGESPLVEDDAFATWEKGMDQLNHNSAAQAHVMWSLPEALKQDLRIDGQRLSDLSTEQLQKIFDTNLQARDTLVGEVTDMLEDGDVSLKMVTKNTAYRSYHIQVDENGKKHVLETPYLPLAERHVLILGFKGDTSDLNVECGFQGRSDIAPEQVAAVIAAAAVATQAPGQPATPTTPEAPSTPDIPTTPGEPHTPGTPEKPDEPKTPKPEEPEVPENPEPEKPGKDADLDPENQGNNKPGHGGIAPPVTGPATPPAVEIGEGGSEDPTNIPEIIAPGADDTTAEEVIEDAAQAGNPVEDINGNPVTPGTNNGRPSDGTVNE